MAMQRSHAPTVIYPVHCATGPAFQGAVPSTPRGRRMMTREQGRALEQIGHATDYLLDTYLNCGLESEVLHGQSPEMQAILLLAQARAQVLRSIPIQSSIQIKQSVHGGLWKNITERLERKLLPIVLRPL